MYSIKSIVLHYTNWFVRELHSPVLRFYPAFTLMITLKYGNGLTLFVFCRSAELNHSSLFSEMPLTSKLAGKK